MGIGKKSATHKSKTVVEGVSEDIPVVGDVVDSDVKSGPMDRAGDTLDKTKNKLDRDKDEGVLRRD